MKKQQYKPREPQEPKQGAAKNAGSMAKLMYAAPVKANARMKKK